MKRFKKIVLLIAVLTGLCVSEANAENNYRDPRFQMGLRGGFGVNQSGTEFTDAMFTPNLSYSLGWKLGNIPLYIEPSLWIDLTKDFEGPRYGSDVVAQFKIPVMVSWHFGLGKNMSVGPMTGPYLGVSTGYNSDDDDIVDFGWRIGAQFNWKKLYVSLGGDFGLINREFEGYNVGATMGFFMNVGVNFISR